MISLVDHVAVTVRSLERSLEFYGKLGFSTVSAVETPVRTRMVEAGGAKIELMEAVGGKPLYEPPSMDRMPWFNSTDMGIKHIALRVEDIEGCYRELKAKGVGFLAEPREVAGGRKLAFFTDPDGVLLHLVEYPK